MLARRSPLFGVIGACLVGSMILVADLRSAAAQDTPAQAVDEASDQEARSLYAAGELAFSAGRFERALEHFRRAYELSHRADLFYNIGLAADRLRRDAEALEAFEAFLASGPDEALRVSVQARVDVLRRTRTSAEREAEQVTVVDAPPPAPSDVTAPIALLVSGAVLAVGGGVLLGVAAAEDGAVQNAATGSTWASVAGHHDAAEALAISGGISLGIGVALAAAGGVWLGTSGSDRGVSVAVRPFGFSVDGRF